MSEMADSGYPVQLEIDAAAPQNRLTVLVRAILAIPHWIALLILGIAGLVVWLVSSLAIVITGRFPAGMLRFQIGLNHWNTRVFAYTGAISSDAIVGGLLTGKYPPFSMDAEPDYPVRLIVPEQVEGRNRLTGFFPIRIILLIPHIIVLAILGFFVWLATLVAWLAGIVLGRIPNPLHNFIAGYTRWCVRVNAYGSLLVDEYPPFSF